MSSLASFNNVGPIIFCTVMQYYDQYWFSYLKFNITRRPASADRTARAANLRRDLEAT